MKNLEIRILEENDAFNVSKMIGRNLLEVNTKDYSLAEMEELANIYCPEKILEISSLGHMYIILNDDKTIGCGAIVVSPEKPDECELLSIFAVPELHGKGIGKIIMKTLEHDEYFLKSKRVLIQSSITACEFYRSLGYDYENGVAILNEDGLYPLEKFQ